MTSLFLTLFLIVAIASTVTADHSNWGDDDDNGNNDLPSAPEPAPIPVTAKKQQHHQVTVAAVTVEHTKSNNENKWDDPVEEQQPVSPPKKHHDSKWFDDDQQSAKKPSDDNWNDTPEEPRPSPPPTKQQHRKTAAVAVDHTKKPSPPSNNRDDDDNKWDDPAPEEQHKRPSPPPKKPHHKPAVVVSESKWFDDDQQSATKPSSSSDDNWNDPPEEQHKRPSPPPKKPHHKPAVVVAESKWFDDDQQSAKKPSSSDDDNWNDPPEEPKRPAPATKKPHHQVTVAAVAVNHEKWYDSPIDDQPSKKPSSDTPDNNWSDPPAESAPPPKPHYLVPASPDHDKWYDQPIDDQPAPDSGESKWNDEEPPASKKSPPPPPPQKSGSKYFPHDLAAEFAGEPFCELPARLPHLPQCCTNRIDDCSRFVRKYNWTCYCDEFCETPYHSDCCPDYHSYCKGDIKNNCNFQGRRYQMNQEVKQNCNLCKCSRTGNELNWRCDNEVCLVRSELVDNINDLHRDGRLAWRAANYTFFWGKTLQEGLNQRLGTLLPAYPEHYKTVHHDLRRFTPDRNFDWRKEQRVLNLGGLHPVRDQQNCNVSYAFSTTAVLSDRLTIHKREMQRKRVAPQFLISCLAAYNRTDASEFCHAKDIYAATGFLRQFESVSEACFPVFLPHHDAASYTRHNSLERWCLDFIRQSHRAQRTEPNYRGDTHCPKTANVARERKATATPWVLIKPEEKQIQYEIKRNGPVIAVFNVREDFFLYKSGIYEYSRGNEGKNSHYRKMGLHSVRVVGWGEEVADNGRTYKYWIADNSWGQHWGENGYFRIARYCNPDCGIEKMIMTAAAGTLHQHRIGLGSRRSVYHRSGHSNATNTN